MENLLPRFVILKDGAIKQIFPTSIFLSGKSIVFYNEGTNIEEKLSFRNEETAEAAFEQLWPLCGRSNPVYVSITEFEDEEEGTVKVEVSAL